LGNISIGERSTMDEEVAVEPAPIHRNAPLQDEKKRQQQQGTLPASPPYSSCRFTTKPDANQPRKQKRMKTISIHLFLAMECEVEVPAHHVSPENMSIILPVRCRDQEDRKWSEAIPVASLGTYIEDVVVMRAWYSHPTWQNCPPFGPCCMWRQRFDLVRTVSQRERERGRDIEGLLVFSPAPAEQLMNQAGHVHMHAQTKCTSNAAFAAGEPGFAEEFERVSSAVKRIKNSAQPPRIFATVTGR
jgi:hypothetical protein